MLQGKGIYMKIQFGYDGNMDLLNALETFKQVLPKLGVEMKILDGGDGYEEAELTKKENQMSQTLVIMQGHPGSGKSTLAKQIAHVIDAEVFSTDDFFVENGVYKFDVSKLGQYHKANLDRSVEAMKAGKNVVIDNTNIRSWECLFYCTAAVERGIAVKFVRAIGNFGTTHGVPPDKIEQMRQNMEELTLEKVLASKKPF
jgi:energy-coupling factor transporter ATP-binding protein EcfA2